MMLSRRDLGEIGAALEYQILAHMEDHSTESWETCPYCQSLASIQESVDAIIGAMPIRMEVWVS